MRYIPRQITDRLLASPKNKATLLLGARQVGKSTLLKHLLSEVPHLWFPEMILKLAQIFPG